MLPTMTGKNTARTAEARQDTVSMGKDSKISWTTHDMVVHSDGSGPLEHPGHNFHGWPWKNVWLGPKLPPKERSGKSA